MRERAGRRNRKRTAQHTIVHSDGTGHGDRFVTDHLARRVEALRDEHSLVHPQQHAGRRIHGCRLRRQHVRRFAAIEGPDVHAALVR